MPKRKRFFFIDVFPKSSNSEGNFFGTPSIALTSEGWPTEESANVRHLIVLWFPSLLQVFVLPDFE